jgi:hypothetical protein
MIRLGWRCRKKRREEGVRPRERKERSLAIEKTSIDRLSERAMGMLLAVLSFFSGSALLLREQRFSCASSSPRALCLKGESKRGAEEGERRGARRAKEESREEDEEFCEESSTEFDDDDDDLRSHSFFGFAFRRLRLLLSHSSLPRLAPGAMAAPSPSLASTL